MSSQDSEKTISVWPDIADKQMEHHDNVLYSCSLSCDRILDLQRDSYRSPAPLFTWSQFLWLFYFFETEKYFQKSSFWDFKINPKECHKDSEAHTDRKLPVLLPKMATTSPSLGSCPKELQSQYFSSAFRLFEWNKCMHTEFSTDQEFIFNTAKC